MELFVLGIRHHGPGSSRNLDLMLEELNPDIILIEGPQDAQVVLEFSDFEELEPPVAILMYDPSDHHGQSVYLPFASFSPEWRAMKFAQKRCLPVRFMDLPLGARYKLPKSKNKRTETGEDPFAQLAQHSGYSDIESWWEAIIEAGLPSKEIFPRIIELMGLMREGVEDPYNELREAWMRRVIREAEEEGFQRIAVVCGAWHSPAIADPDLGKSDKRLLKKVKIKKMEATWIPWTWHRLSHESGYSAGVISPAWFDCLYQHGSEAPIVWMTRVAQLFRENQLLASTAHIIDAVEVSRNLAVIRGMEIPGLQELFDAAISVFCGGEDASIMIIQKELVVGTRIGLIPDSVPLTPLFNDIKKIQKSLKIKLETKAKTQDLDLRKPNGLKKSHFFHRLSLLGIEWGIPVNKDSVTSNFHEYWKVSWDPEYELQIIQAGRYGNTLITAVGNYINEQLTGEQNLPDMSRLLLSVLKADLTLAVNPILERIAGLAVTTTDVSMLLETLSYLTQAWRYGDVRNTNKESILPVLLELIPRISLALPGVAVSLNEEAAQKLHDEILKANRMIDVLSMEEYRKQWLQGLVRITKLKLANQLIAGLCLRLLFEKGEVKIDAAADSLQLALSPGNSPAESAKWLEGFLQGSGLLLIYNQTLWRLLDEWVSCMPEEIFRNSLPALRKVFSKFSIPERKKMMDLGSQERQIPIHRREEFEVDTESADLLLPVLKKLMYGGDQ